MHSEHVFEIGSYDNGWKEHLCAVCSKPQHEHVPTQPQAPIAEDLREYVSLDKYDAFSDSTFCRLHDLDMSAEGRRRRITRYLIERLSRAEATVAELKDMHKTLTLMNRQNVTVDNCLTEFGRILRATGKTQ